MVERRDRNILKAMILDYLAKHGSATAFDIREGLGEEYHNVSNALLRLRRAQLVSREKVRGGAKNRLHWEYTIKPKGLERLSFYVEKGLTYQVREPIEFEEKPKRRARRKAKE